MVTFRRRVEGVAITLFLIAHDVGLRTVRNPKLRPGSAIYVLGEGLFWVVLLLLLLLSSPCAEEAFSPDFLSDSFFYYTPATRFFAVLFSSCWDAFLTPLLVGKKSSIKRDDFYDSIRNGRCMSGGGGDMIRWLRVRFTTQGVARRGRSMTLPVRTLLGAQAGCCRRMLISTPPNFVVTLVAIWGHY